MRSTEFWDFLTPSPSLCPQNLYCLSANLGLFLLPPSSRTSYIEAPLCSYGCPFVPDIVTLLKGCKVVFVVGLARRRTETKMKSTAWRRRISEQLEVGSERGGDRRHGVTEQFRHALEKGRRVKGVIALIRPRVLVHCHSLPPFLASTFGGKYLGGARYTPSSIGAVMSPFQRSSDADGLSCFPL